MFNTDKSKVNRLIKSYSNDGFWIIWHTSVNTHTVWFDLTSFRHRHRFSFEESSRKISVKGHLREREVGRHKRGLSVVTSVYGSETLGDFL